MKVLNMPMDSGSDYNRQKKVDKTIILQVHISFHITFILQKSMKYPVNSILSSSGQQP
jgi:hypothetical protein